MTPTQPRPFGVEILGSGSALPQRRLTNADLEKMMETSDEWIVQRTGIRERRAADWENGEKTSTLATTALQNAIDDAGIDASER
jgi:3-oxoacyl-[acyl-carrier-protein] synthase-3